MLLVLLSLCLAYLPVDRPPGLHASLPYSRHDPPMLPSDWTAGRWLLCACCFCVLPLGMPCSGLDSGLASVSCVAGLDDTPVRESVICRTLFSFFHHTSHELELETQACPQQFLLCKSHSRYDIAMY
jgi:hypothetical protein